MCVKVKTICCIGAGYVGGPTMAVIADKCSQLKVIVVDLNKHKIDSWNNEDLTKLPVYEPGLKDKIELALNHGTINFTTDYETAIANSTIVFICVGTPMKENGDSNLDYVFESAKLIGKYLSNESIIITKSTVPIGTTFKAADKFEEVVDFPIPPFP